MKKKFLILIIIIALLLIFIGFTEHSKTSNEKKVINVAGTNFTIPDKYYENGTNENKQIKITNDTNSFYIGHYNDSYIKNHLNEYFKYWHEQNQSVSIPCSNFTVENNLVYKTVNNQNHVIGYWFEKNNQTDFIHDGGDNSIEESIFLDLIKSANN